MSKTNFGPEYVFPHRDPQIPGIRVRHALCFLHSFFFLPLAACAALVGIGIWDIRQTRHSLRRNYSILAHLRYGLEKIRPEIRC